MKNQYVGDINDYKKYGLLRSIIRATGFRVLVAWILTPDDGSTDGGLVSYLQQTGKFSTHDAVLFQTLKDLLASGQERRVALIENTDLLLNTDYFSAVTPDSGQERSAWFTLLSEQARGADFVFLDPDNGLEVKSKPYGRKWSSKFLYWREVEALWRAGKSLLVYQHFIREKRTNFIQRMLTALRAATPGSNVEAFSTSKVVFLMALQPKHWHLHRPILDAVQDSWEGQIQHWELSLGNIKRVETMTADDFASFADEIEAESKHMLVESDRLIAELSTLTSEEQAWAEWFSGLSDKNKDIVEMCSKQGVFVTADNLEQVLKTIKQLTE